MAAIQTTPRASQRQAHQQATLQWNTNNLDIKSKSVERALEPLIAQVMPSLEFLNE